MTGPLGRESLGDAYVEVHARTDQFRGDLEKGLKDSQAPVGAEADKLGTTVGDRIGKGAEKEVKRSAPRVARELGDSLAKEVVNIRPNFRWNLRGKDGRFISRAAAGIKEEVEDAFKDVASAGGGVFGKIGQAIADALGAGFNVSGKSPLVYALVPIYAALAGLVLAAIQAANGIAAAFTAIPAALSVVGVEIGVLALAFHGLSDAIQGAFAATNADELNAALKDLTPSAQDFVRALLPARDFFKELSRLAQENLFAAFGGGEKITALLEALKAPLQAGIPVVAQSLGYFLGQLTDFFAGPMFKGFLDEIFPATAMIITMLSGPFIHALSGLFQLIVDTLPFLLILTSRFGMLLDLIGDLLSNVSQNWLLEMVDTLDQTFELLGEIIQLIAVIFRQVNADGNGLFLLKFLTDAVEVLTNFLATDVGKEAIAGLIRIGEVGIFVTLALVEALLLLAAGFEWLVNTIASFVGWIANVAWPALQDFFSNITNWISSFFSTSSNMFSTALNYVTSFISNGWGAFVAMVRNSIAEALSFIRSLPGQAVAALGNIGSVLLNAGRSLIQGLINGIQDRIPGLRSLLRFVTEMLPDWKGPEDKDKRILRPAGEAVMEGFGEGLVVGFRDIQHLLGEFTSGLGTLGMNSNQNNISFGPGAVAVNFKGALPSQEQATNTGIAVGAGINSQLASRNTRLAVRTL